ncbi:TPA: 5-methylcytosine-specific restriction endonuclease system specificity protein McrC [Vibrio parahaemolyticus]|nr:5-methylcytosine-specific restriction endonuclease system specificity protein McrC [Vibrio parahaemolyticus]
MSERRHYVGKIPVQNLWLLMLYASESRFLFPQLSDVEENLENVANLIADVLCDLVDKRLKRNLSTQFVETERELTRVRGRINILSTDRTMALSKGRVICSFDELTMDSDRNRYICASLSALVGLVDQPELARRCHNLTLRLNQLGVSDRSPAHYRPSRERFSRYEADDRQVLLVAELAHDMHLLTESLGSKLLPTPDKQKEWVRKLFEKAVGGFYKLKLVSNGWSVKTGKKAKWPVSKGSALGQVLLPLMSMDIVLENKRLAHRLIIDTKFADILTKGRFGNSTFKSNYVYQLYSYVMSQVDENDRLSLNASGMLLHPSLGESYDEHVVIQGHTLRFCTVDLSNSAYDVSSRLLSLVS